MKKPAAKAIVYGIKCDNSKCTYSDMGVTYEEYPEWINKPCPKCGRNLLTQHDYNMCKIMMGIVRLINNVVGKTDYKEEDIHKIEIALNGTDYVGIKNDGVLVNESHIPYIDTSIIDKINNTLEEEK